jgi:hypothetical protein
MQKLRIGLAVGTSVLFSIDFTLARFTGGQIDAGVTAAWLLALGWVFSGGVRDAIKRSNGNGNHDAS